MTDLASNNSTVYSFANPSPIYNNNTNCNSTVGAWLCMQFGDGPTAPNGGNFSLLASSLQAGQFYGDGGQAGSDMSISVDGAHCGTGTFGAGGGPSIGSVELDQYVFTSGPTPVQTVAAQFDCTTATTDISGTIAYNIVPTDPSSGYYLFGQQGELTGFGNDNYLVYLNGAGYYNLNAPIVGMAPTPDGGGYWMVGGDGGVYASGDAGFYGSTGSLHLNKPVVGMAATPDGKGYWFVASDGGIFAYGDAGFYGSTGSIHLNKPIVGMASTPDGPRLLAGRLRRRDLRLRRRRLLRLDGQPAPEQARGRHGRRRPRATATGSWPPTEGSSPTVTPASTARPGASHLN